MAQTPSRMISNYSVYSFLCYQHRPSFTVSTLYLIAICITKGTKISPSYHKQWNLIRKTFVNLKFASTNSTNSKFEWLANQFRKKVPKIIISKINTTEPSATEELQQKENIHMITIRKTKTERSSRHSTWTEIYLHLMTGICTWNIPTRWWWWWTTWKQRYPWKYWQECFGKLNNFVISNIKRLV